MTQTEVYEIIKENKNITLQQIANKTGKREGTIDTNLRKLRRWGFITIKTKKLNKDKQCTIRN